MGRKCQLFNNKFSFSFIVSFIILNHLAANMQCGPRLIQASGIDALIQALFEGGQVLSNYNRKPLEHRDQVSGEAIAIAIGMISRA